MAELKLAAVVYEPGQGRRVDPLLSELAVDLAARGIRIAGTTQRTAEGADGCACDMIVTDLRSGRELSISEDRGPHAAGCRLDSQALAALVGATLAALDEGADLLIVNKFGKQEGEGAGFRDALGRAIVEGIPALVAVNRNYIEAWRAFAGDLGTELPLDPIIVRRWCEAAVGRPLAAGGAPGTGHEPGTLIRPSA